MSITNPSTANSMTEIISRYTIIQIISVINKFENLLNAWQMTENEGIIILMQHHSATNRVGLMAFRPHVNIITCLYVSYTDTCAILMTKEPTDQPVLTSGSKTIKSHVDL